jgi:GT2 family glycosyltransferase
VKKLRLSVVVPMFNEQRAIGPCLDALLPQLTAIHEVIVVDNGSTDGSADVVKAIRETHPAIRLVHEPTQGLVAARNQGFRCATGDILARIDADTQVGPGWATSIVDFFEQHGDRVAGTGLCSLYDAPFQDRYRRAHEEMTAVMRSHPSEIRAHGRLFGSNMAIPTKRWNQIKEMTSTRDDVFEDLDLTLCLQKVGVTTALIPGADATISGRRYLSSPVSHVRYNLCDQRTYKLHGMARERRAAVVKMLTVSLPFYFAMYLPFRAYEPAQQRFTIRAFFGRDRIQTRAHS